MSDEDKNLAAENAVVTQPGDEFEYDDEHLIRAARSAAGLLGQLISNGMGNPLPKKIFVILTALANRFEQARKGQADLLARVNELEGATGSATKEDVGEDGKDR